MTETFGCGIDQLVNFLAALADQPQILATNEIRVTGGADKKKNGAGAAEPVRRRAAQAGAGKKGGPRFEPQAGDARCGAGSRSWCGPGFGLRPSGESAKARQNAVELNRKTGRRRPRRSSPRCPPAPAVPAQVTPIADKMLFDRSRNSTVVVEVPPPPPPKPPMPALPVYHGMMNLGDGPTAFLSVNASAPHQEMIHPGETHRPIQAGETSMSKEIELEWDGKTIHKLADE